MAHDGALAPDDSLFLYETDAELSSRIDDILTDLILQLVHGGERAPELGRRGGEQPNSKPTGGVSFRSHPELFTRMIAVLNNVQALVLLGQRSTLRGLYYHLKDQLLEIAGTPSLVYTAVDKVSALLNAERNALHLFATSKGLIAGSIVFSGVMNDARCTSTGIPIPGDLNLVNSWPFRIMNTARALLLVEKDTVFQRLLHDRIFDLYPCIILTAKGMPDVSTRLFLRRLHEAAPKLPIYSLVDYNPAAVTILMVYRYGPLKDQHVDRRYRQDTSVPSLRWLGIHKEHLLLLYQQHNQQHNHLILDCCGTIKPSLVTSDSVEPRTELVAQQQMQGLTVRDRQLLAGLRRRLSIISAEDHLQHPWQEELDEMEGAGSKCEIEKIMALLGDAFCQWVIRNMQHQCYL
jgi:DNA topoisomerase VI subunit A